ncbi:HIT domain-containing protein [Legionella israelensis]|uniref:HIT domain-containing protein n=1 Tax=Legionella israelensis TaxID=454 RepID=A0AAX1ED49_9GAMM|nr:HIT domain-containing protein [Legionella israelensis]QBR83030.1 HIT domain-containing protein [Legionella israelensis]
MVFHIDSRILSTCVFIAQWELSEVYLKDESRFPWFILIPRVENVQEIHQLSSHHQRILMEEISHVSEIISKQFKPDKINVASLGNIVSQLHIHLVGRNQIDPFWPNGIWQPNYTPHPYLKSDIETLQKKLQSVLKEI